MARSKEYQGFESAIERMQQRSGLPQDLLTAFNTLKSQAEAFENLPVTMFYRPMSNKPRNLFQLPKTQRDEAIEAHEHAFKENEKRPRQDSHLFILKDFTKLANDIAKHGLPNAGKLEAFCRRHEGRYEVNVRLRIAVSIIIGILAAAAMVAVLYFSVAALGISVVGGVIAGKLALKPLLACSVFAGLMNGSIFGITNYILGKEKQARGDALKHQGLYTLGVKPALDVLRSKKLTG